ncbi:MAG: hypothetical protein HZA50_13365, partial [Planctomycetes bacterium]|nr:hypothetical protein [Planctomycetota bacterium]
AVHRPAIKALLEMGPMIVPLLKKAIETTASHEIKTRCRQIIDQIDASLYLEEAKGVQKADPKSKD